MKLFDAMMEMSDIEDRVKIRLGIRFSHADKCLTDGCDEHLQIMRIFC